MAAVIGGLLVGLLGWLAIAAGWIRADASEETTLPLTQPVAGTERERDEARGLSVREIYERSAPGVAHIEATGRTQQPPLGPFGAPAQPAATGSGFVIDEQGHLVTNAHVVQGATDIRVMLGDQEESYEAELVGADPSTDIAVLKIDAPADALVPLELGDSEQLAVGDPVVAIGNPFGLDRTVTAGIVSALQREIPALDGFTISNVIQTDAPINPGNSGGPLLDASGRVVGVNSQIESSTGGNVGIGFAVPAETAREIAQELIADGEVSHAYLGVTGADLTPQVAGVLNLDVDQGALVQAVVPDSPADDAGLRAGDATVRAAGERVRVGGDLIVAVDGEPVTGMDDVVAAVNASSPGDEIELSVMRDGSEREIAVELGERPASRP